MKNLISFLLLIVFIFSVKSVCAKSIKYMDLKRQLMWEEAKSECAKQGGLLPDINVFKKIDIDSFSCPICSYWSSNSVDENTALAFAMDRSKSEPRDKRHFLDVVCVIEEK